MGVGEISEIMGAVAALLFIIFAAVCTVRRANRDYSVRLSDGEWNTPESLPFNPDTELKFQTIIQTYKRA